ncbi:MAG: hypothetical protein F4Y16_04685 [Holophagales bacterium]|nr:hypothetical protein [Holophagales bacterium]MYH25593.1 hypothetical protein [Holophagales bacterium]
MSFPYGDVRARLMVQDCRHVWIRFTESPNLVGGDIGDGYETHMLAARWNDGEPFIVRVRQQWSDKDLIFSDGGIDVASIAGNQTLAVLLDWYDQGRVMWRFPLDGSSAALAEAGCG